MATSTFAACFQSPLQESETAVLLLNDGSSYAGTSFGHEESVSGECVFQTGMVGYPEALTDPSYRGQILVLTFPLVGNYGVPKKSIKNCILEHFESKNIHVACLVVGFYAQDYSHYMADQSLSQWLKNNKIPAVFGIDTRALTKKLRTNGAMLGKLLFKGKGNPVAADGVNPSPEWLANYKDIAWVDPNLSNLVAEVSCKEVTTYQPVAGKELYGKDGKPIVILAIDVGMKNNQIRCFVNRGVVLKVVPWDYDFLAKDVEFDGLFISNGPGDPTQLKVTIDRIQKQLVKETKPVFGICLGHQLMALAAGAQTEKMLFGNRGQNIPCTDLTTGRCYITSQNHGFAVQVSTLPVGWKEYFVNANDGSNEGIRHESLPYFSVQFHPESAPGPWDTEYLFDLFIESVKCCKDAKKLVSITLPVIVPKPLRLYPRKVLVLGSGGLSIGQAGEFDYSGSQAIKALKEEGIFTVLINPNIATIQTSRGLADKVYFLPVTAEFVRKVILHEKPDGIYCTFGGQTALNVGVKLKDEFESLGVKVLGTPIHSIEITEDRELFNRALAEINERTAMSYSATSIQEAVDAANKIGYPLIVRAAYALGGLGSGFADNEIELRELCGRSFATSSQILVERSMKGWKEIEYEVVRDCQDNCITVCNMENFDPLGIHTGDSIVVAPSQTLSDEDYMMLRRTAINVIRHIGVVGECNIQYALNPYSKEYCIIEVNARLSRSSALASKATGYPLAFVAAKLGLGIPLTEVKNSVTKKTIACFEPSLDYCIVKIPRWDLKKFNRVSSKISSAMKSVGEVMAIGRTFEETIQKAIRAVEYSFIGFSENKLVVNIDEELSNPSDERLFAIANAFHQGYSIDKVHDLTKIDKWFLHRLKRIADLDILMKQFTPQTIPENYLRYAKQMGFSDRQIALCISTTELAVRKIRKGMRILPYVKQIDTVAAEFPCYTNYLYTTYNAIEHDVTFEDKGIMVLGSGVYRIGSSVEFDWCAVRCIRTLRAMGKKTVMINYNPETVSTDYDEADKLYFETLTLERVLDIYELENSAGVVVCMGGQTPNNIALPLLRENVKILGTSPEMIDRAENRFKFSRMCDKIGVDQPQWKELTSEVEATLFCEKVGFPVLVRPSYVLSGAGMTVVNSQADLLTYLAGAGSISHDFPVVISKFIEDAKEIEMDGVAHEGKLIMHIVTEHVENAGVHSGDATLILPPQDLDPETVSKIEEATTKIASALHVTGPFNIQFIAKNNEIKIIECNVRASRSFPFVSKVRGIDMIELATKAIMNEPYEAYPTVEIKPNYVAVKVPQFSFARLAGADPILGVEMASTGEVACFGANKYEAYLKALIATGFQMPKKNILISIGSFKEKMEFLPSVQKLKQMGFNLFATAGTSDFLMENNIPCKYLESLDETETSSQKLEYSLHQHLTNSLIDLYINLPSKNKYRRPASYMSHGYRSRRMAVDFAIPLITNVKCAKLFVEAMSRHKSFEITSVDSQTALVTHNLPGLINVSPNQQDSREAVEGGFTLLANQSIMMTSFCDYALLSDSANQGKVYLNSTDVSYLNEMFAGSADICISSCDALSTCLLLSSMYQKQVHFTNVATRRDLDLILLAKSKCLNVTFDVDVHSLFELNSEHLWENLTLIDCFSVTRNHKLAISLLLNAVAKGRLNIDDLVLRLHGNPARIFNLPSQADTYTEVETNETIDVTSGAIHRVVLGGNTIYLEGEVFGEPSGRKVANLLKVHNEPKSPMRMPSLSMAANVDKSPRVRLFHDTPLSVSRTNPEAPNSVLKAKSAAYTYLNDLKTPHIPSFYQKHITSVRQFQRSDLHTLFGVAQEMKTLVEQQGQISMLNGKIMCSAFWEPSTRTSCSFETAMTRLGGGVVSINQITSSIAKGESLSDTVRTLASYGDVIVMRHPSAGSAQIARQVSAVPVINAGDGTGEHPTQAFLDIYTIREELGTVNGLSITIVGDLLNGRTVHSLVQLLTLYSVRINYVSPPGLKMPREIIDLAARCGIQQHETTDLSSVMASTDVLYVTRMQKERFADESSYEAVKDSYIITNAVLKTAKEHMIIMHPLPRINEIDAEVDFDPRAAYFRQMRYGLYVRMALLALVVGRS